MIDGGQSEISGTRTGFCVTLEAQHDLWRSVPPSGDIFGHVTRILLRVHGKASSETKIADLQFAIGVNEKVTRFQVSMQDIGGVNVLQTAENLVDEGLKVGISKRLPRSNDGGQIALHELYDDVSAMAQCTSLWNRLYLRKGNTR
jgi:hypothetical protein